MNTDFHSAFSRRRIIDVRRPLACARITNDTRFLVTNATQVVTHGDKRALEQVGILRRNLKLISLFRLKFIRTLFFYNSFEL